MELVSVYLGLKKARRWDSNKARTLGGSYAHALKHIYGDQYVDVDLKENKKIFYSSKPGDIIVFGSELV